MKMLDILSFLKSIFDFSIYYFINLRNDNMKVTLDSWNPGGGVQLFLRVAKMFGGSPRNSEQKKTNKTKL